jgi:hypothetical protein
VLVGAWVYNANVNAASALNHGSMDNFDHLNEDRGLFLLTAQNNSIENLTLTGSWYYGNDYATSTDDALNILWADAQYNMDMFNIGLQGGTVMHDQIDETEAFGAKIGAKLGMFNTEIDYSTVNDSTFGVFNVGGTSSVLYTDMIQASSMNSYWAASVGGQVYNNNDTFVIRADADVLGGNLGAAYGWASYDNDLGDVSEFDVTYSTKVFGNTSLEASYSFMDADGVSDMGMDANNMVRFVARYNF